MADNANAKNNDGKSIAQRLVYAIESLVELQVYTCVCNEGFLVENDNSGSGLVVRPPSTLNVESTFYTEINLVSGDIVSIVPRKNLASDDPLRTLHEANVKQGTEIVANNVQALKEVLKDFKDDVKDWLLVEPSGRASKQNLVPTVPAGGAHARGVLQTALLEPEYRLAQQSGAPAQQLRIFSGTRGFRQALP
jgi:hypothetical protein